jgi:hypothetical protein
VVKAELDKQVSKLEGKAGSMIARTFVLWIGGMDLLPWGRGSRSRLGCAVTTVMGWS